MSEPEEITPLASPAPVQEDETPAPPSPPPPPPPPTSESPPEKPVGVKFSIWPPTQRTRDAVISRLIETLSSPSILSKRYGTIPHDEASSVARVIEEEAFSSAGGAFTTEDDGIEVLQVYSKEISKRMLDAVKARSAPMSPAENGEANETTPPVPPATTVNEEIES